MHETFKLTIRTPQETLFDGEAKSLSVASEGGEMEIFADHASLTTSIAFSPLIVTNKEDVKEEFIARNGMLLFNNKNNAALVLALHAEKKSEVSHKTVKEYAKFIDEQLAKGADLSDFQILFLKGEKIAVEQQLEEESA